MTTFLFIPQVCNVLCQPFPSALALGGTRSLDARPPGMLRGSLLMGQLLVRGRARGEQEGCSGSQGLCSGHLREDHVEDAAQHLLCPHTSVAPSWSAPAASTMEIPLLSSSVLQEVFLRASRVRRRHLIPLLWSEAGIIPIQGPPRPRSSFGLWLFICSCLCICNRHGH